MAISALLMTTFGEERTLYVRLNNAEPSNHGVPTHALFRGYISKEAFDAGSGYVWEKAIEFMADVSLPLWPQAYAALVAQEGFDPTEV
jgi:hypothetical protein